MYYWSKPTLPWKKICLPYWTVLLEEVIIKQEFGLCWPTEWTKVQSSHCYYELQLISCGFRTRCSFTAARSMNAEKTFRTSWWASSPALCASTPPPCPEMISETLHFSVSFWHNNTSTHMWMYIENRQCKCKCECYTWSTVYKNFCGLMHWERTTHWFSLQWLWD